MADRDINQVDPVEVLGEDDNIIVSDGGAVVKNISRDGLAKTLIEVYDKTALMGRPQPISEAMGNLHGRIAALEKNGIPQGVVHDEVEAAMQEYIDSGAFINLSIPDGSLERGKVNSEFESTLAKADSAMQPSVYDPNGFGSRSTPVDPYSYATTQADAKKNEILQTNNFTVTDTQVGNVASGYVGLTNALNGVLNRAEIYTQNQLSSYTPFSIQIVPYLDTTGQDNTFYLVPNASGTGYDKYWYITNENGVKQWDAFGGSSTLVVNALPSNPDPDIDYILVNNDEYKYYKWISNQWALIAGSSAVTIDLNYTLDFKGHGTPSAAGISNNSSNQNKYYIDLSRLQIYRAVLASGAVEVTWEQTDTLVTNPTESRDYFVRDNGNKYLHFRYKNNQFYMVGSDAYSKEEIDQKIAVINTSIGEHTNGINANASNIRSLSGAIDKVAQDLSEIDVEGVTYSAALSTEDNQVYTFTLYEIEDGEETVKSQFVLPATGGGGGAGPATTLVVDRVTTSPIICTPTDSVVIEVDFSSVDSDNEQVDATYTIKRGTAIVMSGNMVQGRNSFNVTEYCSIGTQKFTLTVTDEGGSVNVKSWTVQIADVRLESSFSDRYTYPANSSVNFTYTPHGAIPKTIHFKLDGVELQSVTTSASGTLQSYTLPAQSHGAHLLECWITATINNTPIETDHIFRDIIWYDQTSRIPIIGCIYRYDYYGEVTARQYNTTTIPYIVYDPRTSTPNVTLSIDGVPSSNLRLTTYANTWAYKSDEIAAHTLTITCGDTSVDIHMNIIELGYDISPVTGNLEFDFNPVGYSNSSTNRLWKDKDHPSVALTVSNNFDWDNGGYKLDENGNQYFLVKSGTRAYISYNLFGRDPKLSGAEFKVIFKTSNVRDNTTTFLSCIPEDETPVGIQMQAHNVSIYTSTDTLFVPYSEEDIIEFEYNINALDLEQSDATSYIMAYEDGVGARPLIYNDSHRLYQYQPVPITIGSDDCDVYIYRMKAYSAALTDTNVLKNFIADSLNSETMIARYERNQIYTENNELTPESVANACPDLKIIKIECPHFTNDKKDYVKYSNVECIHKNGDPILDNWKFVNGYHVGQGTTSNEYGYAGRNIDIIFGFDGQHQVVSKIPLESDYITELTLGDGTKYSDGSGKVALTRTSVPNNWFNIKVNIASSENANNALLQKRYNDYLPYQTPAMRRDPKIKNSMEFCNCVIFIKESDPNVSTHREFQDTNWHFYGIGNLGDSKKTDNTRVNDPTDLKEFVVEVSDNTLPNSWFQTGVYKDANDNITYDPDLGVSMVYPITSAQWNNENNLKRISLYDAWDDSFEFRYDMGTKDGETISSAEIKAQQAESKQVWRNMYEFVVTSSDSDFVSHLGDWFIVESPLYWYLFTERYTMIDNRAKNSFWHWGKTYITTAEATEMGDDAQYYTIDDTAAAINNGYRFDLWDYDNDTALGINNSGELTMTYGHEDIDYKEDGNPASGFIYNAADSVFWRRIRKLMHNQLQSMYLNRESEGCWSATSLINQFDAWQEQFPEELWRLDIERKYLRTYFGGTERFLKTMMNGRKRYQRRQFEHDQEAYIGTKYIGTTVRADQIMFRCNTPQTGVVVRPNYTLNIVPYSDMYLTVLYGNSPTPQQIRAKAGQEYEITTTLTEMDDTAILIYCASRIQALNDLSACYIHDNDFSKASKLKTLIIGSTVQGYQNTFLTTLNMGNNTLLETLDIRNCPNLVGSINLSACINLENLYAEGTSISSASFARNGKIKKAHFPETVSTLSFLNLTQLTDLVIPSYDNLETFICEYSDVDALGILQNAINTLQTVRILGIDWEFANTNLLNRCIQMNSSLLTGEVYISGTIRNQELTAYEEKWPDLTIEYDINNLVMQHLITYVNDDANQTVLWQTYVDQGDYPIDPIAQNIIDTPTKQPDNQYTYTYSGWDEIETSVVRPRTIIARYTKTVRTYTVRWFARTGILLKTMTDVAYGSECVYLDNNHDTPTWTDDESKNIYHIFAGWDKSTGYIKGDMDVYAVWDTTNTLPGIDEKKMNEMSVSEIYGICRAGFQGNYFDPLDYVEFNLGQDFNFSNVISKEIGKDVLLTGIQRDRFVSGGYYFDGFSGFTTDLVLFGENSPSFTMAIDFQFADSQPGQTLISTHEGDTAEGFRLYQNGNRPTLQFGDQSISVGWATQRDIVVLRHPANSRYLFIYTSGADSTAVRFAPEVSKKILLRSNTTITNEPLSFGGVRYENGFRYMGKGTIHWCKIWMDDLGEDVAYKLASWPHEKIRMEYWGSQKYYYTNSNAPCLASWICNHPIGGLQGRGYWMNSTNTNVGGWNQSLMRTFLNTMVLNALPTKWQSIVQSVEIKATAGAKSTQIISSNDKIYLISRREGDTTATGVGYIGEIGTSAQPIDWFTSQERRAKFNGKIRDYNSTVYESQFDPAVYYQISIEPGDIWINTSNENRAYIFVSQDELDQYGKTPTEQADSEYAQGGWIIASQWWTRSPQAGNDDTHFVDFGQMGQYRNVTASTNNLNNMNDVICVVPAFSI